MIHTPPEGGIKSQPFATFLPFSFSFASLNVTYLHQKIIDVFFEMGNPFIEKAYPDLSLLTTLCFIPTTNNEKSNALHAITSSPI